MVYYSTKEVIDTDSYKEAKIIAKKIMKNNNKPLKQSRISRYARWEGR